MKGPGRTVGVVVLHPKLTVTRGSVERMISVLDSSRGRFLGGCPEGELSVALMTDKALAKLHERYLGDPSVTDVITFEGDAAAVTAGEICVSVDAAIRQAGKRSLSPELTLYIVHGWLHLAGYDDLKPAAKRVMRRAEARAMKLIGGNSALPRFKLA